MRYDVLKLKEKVSFCHLTLRDCGYIIKNGEKEKKDMYFKPIMLAVDGDSADLNITDNLRPQFTWAAEHSEDRRHQSAYRIVLSGDKGTKWDSGVVKSEKQNAVYSGTPFADHETLTWELFLYDDGGAESVSAKNRFMTGITGDWRADWITTPWDKEREVKYFSKEFDLCGEVKKAYLNISGIGYHSAEINGASTSDDLLQPAISNYAKQCYYTVYDVTNLLVNGKNKIEVAVGEGWRRNIGEYLANYNWRLVEFFGVPKLTLELKIEYADGREEAVLTDESWLCGHGGTVSSNLFDGETFDERIETRYTENAVKVTEDAPKMRVQSIRNIRKREKFAPKTRIKVKNGYIFDFGINIAGIGEVLIPGGTPVGTEIRFHYAENIMPDGSLDTETLRRAKVTDVFISDGRAEDRVWHTKFVYHGFRYLFVEGWHGVPDSECFRAVEVYTDVKNNSYFKCGSPIVNAIQECIVRTEKNNIHSTTTDCPQRDERMCWLNDATVRYEEAPYNFNMSRLFSKIIDDIVAEQDSAGAFTCTAPFVYGERPADPVCSSFLMAALENYLHYGNDKDIREHYNNFKAWNECLKNNSTDGIVTLSHYGDWAGPADYCDDPVDGPHSIVTPGILMSTGYHYYNYKLLQRFAELLGDDEEVRLNKSEAERVQKAFLDKWWNEHECIVDRGSQGSQAFALWLGILPENKRKAAARKLHEAVEAVGYRITTGNLTTRYLMDMLCEYGYTDDAWRIITREQYPSWGYMLQNGATTVWERFEFKRGSGMNSHDHPMYGAVGYWFYSYIAGLKPGADGWQNFKLKPYMPKDLLYAEALVETPYGNIYTKWQKQLGATDVILEVPFGCSAEVCLSWGECVTVNSGHHDFHFSED